MLVDELRPRVVIIGVGFYKYALSYMVGCFVRRHKGVYVAVVAMDECPADIGMVCICNGVKSFVNIDDGFEQFDKGLDCVKQGKCFISPSVVERMEKRDVLPEPSVEITERELTVLRFEHEGYTGAEIAEEMNLCLDTVNFHKKEMYKKFGVRNETELINAAEEAGYDLRSGKRYFPRNYGLKPKIKNQKSEPYIRRVK